MIEQLVYKTTDMNLKPDEQNITAPVYTPEEKDYERMIITRLETAVRQRQQPWSEFNDQTYDEWYISNAKAANAYAQPKKNRHDVRTVTGTTREKKNTLLAAILNYNLDPDVFSFDEDNLPVVELGAHMADWIKRSRQIETIDHDAKRELYYSELLDQGNVYVWEKKTAYRKLVKTLKGKLDVKKIISTKWTERIERVEEVLESEMLMGPQVYLGNMKEKFIEFQPFVVLRFIRTRQEAEAVYGDWERWGHVAYKLNKLAPEAESVTYVGDGANTYNNWRMQELDLDLCEELIIMDKWNNEIQIVLNGVMMLPIRFPLSEFAIDSEYPIAKGDLEPISRYFAYCRSIPSKTKVNQALIDEMLKAIILKTRKSYQPPIANMTGQTLSPKIWYPGTIHDNVNPDKIKEIGVNVGITAAEMQAYQVVKSIIDENSVSPVFEGQASTGGTTAREVMQQQQQALMRLGLTLYGIVQFEKKLAWLRLKNILKNYADPIDESFEKTKGEIQKTVKKFRSEAVDSTDENGQKVTKIMSFTDQPLPAPEQVMAQEDILSKRRGVQIRKIIFSADEFKNMKYKWHVEINPQPKDSGELKSAVFMDNVTQGFTLFGPQSFNQEYLKEQWAVLNKLNPEKVLAKTMPTPPGMPPVGGQPGNQPGMPPMPPQQGGPSPSQQLQPKMMPKPSVNAMAQAA